MYRCTYVEYSARRQVRPSTCTTRVVHISVYYTKERSEVVCQVLSLLSQWSYGNTFHYTHRHKSDANTTTKHRIPQLTPKLSQPVQPQKNLNQGNWSDRRSNPGPTRWEATMLHLYHSDGLTYARKSLTPTS